MAAPHPALLSLVRHGSLPTDLTVTIPLVDSAIEHGLAPMLDKELTDAGTPGDLDALKRLAAWSMKDYTHGEATRIALATLVETCSKADIEPAIFKGHAVADRWYDPPELRPSHDIDVFVDPDHPGQISRLASAFDDSPGTHSAIVHMQSEGRVFAHTTSIGSISLDIHSEPWNLLLPVRQQTLVWKRTESLPLRGGGSIRVPDLEMSLMLALIHLIRDNFANLLRISDVGRMIDAKPDWDFIARFAAEEGWTDMIRFSLGFTCDTLARPSPLPRHLSPRARALTTALWPPRYLLQGARSVVRSHRRGMLLSVLIRGRGREFAVALMHRLFPSRSYIDYRYPNCRYPYPIALASWRISQHHTYRSHSSRALNLRNELDGQERSRERHN